MCGIICAYNKDKKNNTVNALIKTLYHNQSERGAQGFGYAGFNDSHLFHERATTQAEIFERMDERAFSTLLFHHRLPTSTDNRENACHPFRVEMDGRVFFLAHNGQVSNDYELGLEHKKLGIEYTSEGSDKGAKYTSFNDSEALAVEFALYACGKISKPRAEGSITFICLEATEQEPVKLWYYHNDVYPLYRLNEGGLFVLASKGDFDKVKKNKLYCHDFKTEQTTKRKLKLKQGHSYQNNYGGYYSDVSKNWDKGEQQEIGFKYDFSEAVNYDFLESYELRTMSDDELINYWLGLVNDPDLPVREPLYYEYLDDCEQELERRGLN